jgi:hypothetical protein
MWYSVPSESWSKLKQNVIIIQNNSKNKVLWEIMDIQNMNDLVNGFYEEYFLTYLVPLSELQWAVHAAKVEKYEIHKEFLWVKPHGY